MLLDRGAGASYKERQGNTLFSMALELLCQWGGGSFCHMLSIIRGALIFLLEDTETALASLLCFYTTLRMQAGWYVSVFGGEEDPGN